MLKSKKTSILLMVTTLLFCLLAVGAVSAADPPIANYTSNVTNGTGPLSVQFNDTSTGNVTSWNWDFGDNGTSTEQNPIHTYTNAGVYSVKLTAFNTDGNSTLTKSNCILVSSIENRFINPGFETGTLIEWTAGSQTSVGATRHDGNYGVHFNFPGDQSSNWVQQSIDLTAVSSISFWGYGEGDTFPFYTYIDGILVASPNAVSNTWTQYTIPVNYTGVHTIAVKWYGNGWGGSDIDDFSTNITNTIADFTATPTNGRTPLTVQFTDKSIGLITTWAWDFNNDGIVDSTEQNPTYTYTLPGNYTVTLNLTGPFYNSTKTIENLITIVPPTNTRTNKTYNSIQAAIDDLDTIDGDTILVGSGSYMETYTENVNITKMVNIIAGGKVIISALDANNPVFSILAGGTNSLINGFLITGATNSSGIYIAPSVNGTILNNTITGNNIGINVDNGTASIYFNNIYDNTLYGLEFTGNGVNAANNWWGTNNPTYANGTTSPGKTDIYEAQNENQTIYDPWIVLNLSTSDNLLKAGDNSTITADMTHNSQGQDTSGQGTIPEIPITFNYTLGTLTTTNTTTSKGRANTTITAGNTSGTENASATVTGCTTNIPLTVDTIAPTVNATPIAGTYNTTQTLILTCDDPTSTIYYTINSDSPNVNSTIYTDPITIENTSSVKFAAIDPAGNWSPIYTRNYVIGNITANGGWIEFQNNNQHTGQSSYVGAQTNTIIWTYTTGGTIYYASPVIGADGILYIGSYDGKLYALNPDGTLKWNYTTGGYIYSSATIGSDGTVYVGSYDSKLYALNPDGTLQWTYTTGARIYGSPAIGADGTIYVGSYDKKIYAINPDGTPKWTYTTGGYIYSYGSAPTIGSDGTIYIGSYDKKLYAINPDGTPKWTYTTGGYIYGSAVIDSNGTIYIGCYDGNLYALNHNGTLEWSYNIGRTYGSPVINSDGTLYIGTYSGTFYAFKDVLPVANYTVIQVTDNTLQFKDESNYAVSYLWDFGDGTTSTEKNPTHTYAKAETYTVTFTVTNKIGNDTKTKTIYYVTADLASGTYNTTQSLNLDTDSSMTIYYTIDGSDPTTSSTKIQYTAPIIINSTTTLRYTAVSPEGNWSIVFLRNYVIGNGTLSNNGQSEFTGPSNSSLLWTYTNNSSTFSHSTPTVGTDGTIYIGDDNGIFYAFNPDGTVKWTYSTGGAIRSVPVIAEGTIYVGSNDGYIYALAADGTLKWKIGGSNPVLGTDGTIYISGKALNPDGTVKWNSTASGVTTVSADGTIYVAGGTVYALNQDGTVKWTYSTGWSAATVVLGPDGTVYTESWNNIIALNQDGTVKWTCGVSNIGGNIENSPAIGADGTIYIGNTVGVFEAINPDGTVKWVGYQIAGPYVGSTPVIGADGTIYLTSRSDDASTGWIYALNSDGTVKWTYNTGYSERMKLSIGSNGNLYVTGGSVLYAFSAVDFVANETSFPAAPAIVQFTDNSPNSPTAWYWDFGDGTNSTQQNPTHAYNTQGFYTVTLTTTYANGSTSYITKSNYINIYNIPIASFTANITSGQAPVTVQFNDTPINSPTSWFWDFGDGTNSTQQNPTHTYTIVNNYTVTLTVSNTSGNTTASTLINVLLPPPTADFTANTRNTVTWGANNVTVQFNDTSTYNPTSWLWNFGDGTSSTEQNPTHTYNIGNYTVSLTATNAAGNKTKTKIDYISINKEPLTLTSNRHIFIYVANIDGVRYDLDGALYGGPNGTYYIKADGGGLNALTIDQLTTSTNSTGSFIVVEGGGSGGSGEIILLVSVEGPISDNFSVNIISNGYNSTSGTYSVLTLNETFTKEDLLYGPTLYKPGPGTLGTWSLLLYNNENTSDNSTASYLMFIDLYANGRAQVNFTFNNMTTVAAFNVYTWRPDGNQGEGISWTNNPTVSGYVVIGKAPVADFTANSTHGTSPLTVQFTDTSTYSPTNWVWDFGDGTNSTQQNPTHTYNNPGTYTVTLTTSNNNGNNTLTQTDLIKVGNPELVASNLELPTNPINGTTYTINTTVTNTGISDAGEFVAKIYDNNIQVGKIVVNELAAGANTILNFNWTPTTVGNHVLSVIADTNNQINETNQNNNQITQTVTTIASTLPELVTSNLQLPTGPVNGTTYIINVTVANTGLGDAGSFVVKLYDNNTQVAKITINGLPAGANTILNFNWTPTTVGNHVLSAIADTNNQINETTRTNNQITKNVNTTASTLPDLTVSNLELPETPVIGNTYTVNVTITNTGTNDITSNFAVKLYDNNTQIQKITVNSLAASASTVLTFNWTPTTNGTHNLSAIADANKQLIEATESNNQITQNVAIA